MVEVRVKINQLWIFRKKPSQNATTALDPRQKLPDGLRDEQGQENGYKFHFLRGCRGNEHA